MGATPLTKNLTWIKRSYADNLNSYFSAIIHFAETPVLWLDPLQNIKLSLKLFKIPDVLLSGILQ